MRRGVMYAPWANAWTCVVLMGIQPNQIMPFTIIVASIAPDAIGGSSAAFFSPPGSSFWTDSCRIWRNDMTMMIEKTKMPRGSRRRRPTYRFVSA